MFVCNVIVIQSHYSHILTILFIYLYYRYVSVTELECMYSGMDGSTQIHSGVKSGDILENEQIEWYIV